MSRHYALTALMVVSYVLAGRGTPARQSVQQPEFPFAAYPFRPDFETSGLVYVADRGTAFMGPRQAYRSADGGLPAAYTSGQAHTGARSIRAGIVSGPPVYSYSDARQWVTLPASNTLASAMLRLWRLSRSTETTTSLLALTEPAPGAGKLDNGALPAGALAGDLQYLLIVRPDASYRWLLRERANRSDWRISEHDLSAYAGQTIAIQFGVYNDNAGGITAMHVDDVTLTVCLRK